jgi:hypothetical protein
MSGVEIFRGDILDEITKFVDNSSIRAGFVFFNDLSDQINEVIEDEYGA